MQGAESRWRRAQTRNTEAQTQFNAANKDFAPLRDSFNDLSRRRDDLKRQENALRQTISQLTQQRNSAVQQEKSASQLAGSAGSANTQLEREVQTAETSLQHAKSGSDSVSRAAKARVTSLEMRLKQVQGELTRLDAKEKAEKAGQATEEKRAREDTVKFRAAAVKMRKEAAAAGVKAKHLSERTRKLDAKYSAYQDKLQARLKTIVGKYDGERSVAEGKRGVIEKASAAALEQRRIAATRADDLLAKTKAAAQKHDNAKLEQARAQDAVRDAMVRWGDA